MGACKGCKFRMFTGRGGDFHCAANVNGWAYVSNERRVISMPPECNQRIPGDGTKVDGELPAGVFWKTAGALISAEDWETWRRRGVNPSENIFHLRCGR